MSVSAMKQALEALEDIWGYLPTKKAWPQDQVDEAIQTLRQAIAEAEKQEPVAWMWKDGTLTSDPDFADGTWTPLFTSPVHARPVVHTVRCTYPQCQATNGCVGACSKTAPVPASDINQEQKTPLKVLGLTVFTENRLRNGRVYDLETLQAMTPRDILAIPDMGKKSLKEVLEALDAYASDMSEKHVHESDKHRHELAGTIPISNGGIATSTPTDFFAPPKREWVGLTKDEVDSWELPVVPTVFQFAQFVEAKLKEKNA